MASNTFGADGEQFLGALLGMAIGDALGMPVVGWSAERIHERYGLIDGYHQRIFDDGAEIKAGEFTDESEAALCIVESFTANQGELDPDNIGARLGFLAAGESRRWMGDATHSALARAADTLVYQVPLDDDGPATGDVAARGVAIGLIHSVGAFDPSSLQKDAELVTRITHGSPLAINATAAVAYAVQLAARRRTPPDTWARETASFIGFGAIADALSRAAELFAQNASIDDAVADLGNDNAAIAVVPTGIYAAMEAQSFEQAVFTAVNAGGATDARGAIAGAIAGATFGAGGIPQQLIDDLEGRIYVSLAAPWFYRTARRRAGLVIDLTMQ
jgi:ADP-ribosyl-[dinitrogen reductase] hydrolase